MLIIKFLTLSQKQIITKKFLYYNGLSLRFYLKYQNTFHFKILTYFENTLNEYKTSQMNAVSTKLRENQLETKVIQKKLNYIYKCIQDFSNIKSSENIKKKLLLEINTKCNSIIDSLEVLELLIIINKLLKIISIKYRSTRILIYDKALTILRKNARNGLLSEHAIIQLIFFLSLKDDREYNNELHLLEKFLPVINNLPLIEQSIISVAYYRSNVKLSYTKSKEINQSIEKYSKQLLHNPELIVSLCKILRISTLNNELVLENLSKAIVESKHSMNFITTTHIIALYAVANLFHAKVIERIMKNFFEFISDDIKMCCIRLKDLARFLWAAGYLQIILTDNVKTLLNLYIEQRFTQLKSKNNLGLLVDTLLSLHILQSWNNKIIEKCLQENIFQTILMGKYHWKIKSRLHILLTQISLEMKIKLPPDLKKNIYCVYESSENLNKIKDIGNTLVKKGIIRQVIMEYPIQTLYIPGVTLIDDKIKYHIDILNDSTCLRNSNTPNGLMNLKIRLLSQLKYQHILITKDIIEKDHAVEIESKIWQKIVNTIKIPKVSNQES